MNVFDDMDVDTQHLNLMFPTLNVSEGDQYYDINKFRLIDNVSMNDLSIFHLNIRSLLAPGKLDNLLGLLKSLNNAFDLICLTESWLSLNTLALAHIDGYSAFHSLRTEKRRGGGVTVYVRNDFKSRNISEASLSLF